MGGPSTTGLAALIGGEDWHYVGDTDEPAFANSWANFGATNTLAFRIREAGVVDIHGVIVPGTLGATIFTLPEGYRPSPAPAWIPIVGPTTTPTIEPGRLVISTSGAVSTSTLGTAPTAVYISGQFFINTPT